MAKQNSIYKFPLAILLLAQFVSVIPYEVPFLSLVWLVWIIICSYYAFKIITEKNAYKVNFFAFVLVVFWIINAISYYISPKIVQSLLVEVETLVIIKSITITLFTFFPFYYFAKHGFIKGNNLNGFVILLYIASFLYLLSGSFLQAQITLEDKNVVDQAYLFVQLIPLIMLFFKGRQLYILMALSGLIILWGSKRGAILCMAFEMLVFFIYLLKEEPFGKKHRGAILIVISFMVLIGAYYVLENDFLQERLLNTGSGSDRSGEIRSERYITLWTIYFNNSSISELLFGYGFAQTVTLGEGLAHQDWIELLIDNGFIGLFLYVLLIAINIKNIIKWNAIVPKVVKYALACVIIDWCLTSTYSMVYASRETYIMFITLGIINGYIQKAKKEGLQSLKMRKRMVYNNSNMKSIKVSN